MDVSPEYVKMCTAAAEIQESRPLIDPLSFGDVFCCPTHGVIILGMMSVGLCCGTPENPVPKVWLPRQDQLQGIIAYENEPAWHLLETINKWCQSQLLSQSFQYLSMEQLWLIFLFYLKGQHWDGEEWVKS